MNVSEKLSNPLLAKSQASSLESSLMGLTLIPALTLFCFQVKFLKAGAGTGDVHPKSSLHMRGFNTTCSSAQLVGKPWLMAHLGPGKVQTQLIDLNFWLHLGAI